MAPSSGTSTAPSMSTARILDEKGVPYGDTATLTGFRIHVLPFRDTDNIQTELTAPIG